MKTLRTLAVLLLFASCSKSKYCPCENYGDYWFANCEDDVINRLFDEQPDEEYLKTLVRLYPCTEDNF